MKRDPITNPQVGDYWELTSWKIIIIFSEKNRVVILEKRDDEKRHDNGQESVFDTSLVQLKTIFKGRDYKFIGNHPEKMSDFKTLSGIKMNNTILTTVIMPGKDFKENLIDRERAIIDPQAGDRWVWPDGVSIEVYTITPPQYGEEGNNVCYASSFREISSRQTKGWRAFLHAATFVGNFAPKTEKRDPLKNPQVGDRWKTTKSWNYNSNTIILANETFQVSEVTEKDLRVIGYFSNGIRMGLSLSDLAAAFHGNFEFVGNFV